MVEIGITREEERGTFDEMQNMLFRSSSSCGLFLCVYILRERERRFSLFLVLDICIVVVFLEGGGRRGRGGDGI